MNDSVNPNKKNAKYPQLKKIILDPSICNSKYAFQIQKSIIEKSFWIHQSIIEIRLPDSAIYKSIIYANFASGTSPHPEYNMIHF